MSRSTSRSSGFVSKAVRLAIYRRDNFSCAYCKKSLKNSDITLSLDHILPESTHGADHSATNLITCCTKCNSSRGNKSIAEYAGKMTEKRILRQVSKPLDLEYATRLIKSLGYHDTLKKVKRGK